jgi:glycerol-3-phosphate dehydrogenase (NAD+)
LTTIINRDKQNPKYLPGVTFTDNILAIPDLKEATRDATVLVFVLPHQFVRGVCHVIKPFMNPNVRAISLVKGLEIKPQGVTLFSEEISLKLGIPVAALSGANIASEVGLEQFSETTIGTPSTQDGELFYKLFNTNYFRVNIIQDHVGVELCGALKNIVAVGAGLSDGLG